jgi:AcrR family transcriptional regulator/DNA-binding MarR family transcriptional regulator
MSVEAGVRRRTLRGGSRGGSTSPRVQVLEMQRARLLSAATITAGELGWSGASVAHITARARVSRRTFYDLFANREECLIAVLDDVVTRMTAEFAAADLQDLSWRERVREGLWTILCFLDREPVLARVCVVQSVAGGRRVLERRTEILARLAVVVDTGRGESRRAADIQSLTAEGLVGATVSILYARILNDEHGSLSGLLNELMSMIVLPYLGASAARREQARALPRVPHTDAADRSLLGAGVGHEDPLRDVPMRLTYRTARVLEAVSGNPGASNRVIAEGAGIFDQGQVSKLLARLERLGLIKNTSGNNDHKLTGEPNAWRLTPRGEEIERAVRVRPGDSESRHNDKNERSRR